MTANNPSPAVKVSLTSVSKKFAQNVVLENFSIDVFDGEFLALLGPSGCGKTTVLNLIAGFFPPNAGTIKIKGVDVSAKPAFQRNTALVFQNYALFPHLDVISNVGFGLRIRDRLSKDEMRPRALEALAMVKMADFADRFPAQLSGGQQQRVALARAVVMRPDVLLLDEPLSNLDANLREEMQVEIRNLQRQIGVTTILVTHDQAEAFAVSDRIALMTKGEIVQLGAPSEIYRQPNSEAVATFVGRMNRIPGRVSALGKFEADFGDDVVCALQVKGARPAGIRGEVMIRPESIRLLPGSKGNSDFIATGTLVSSVYLGVMTQMYVRIGKTMLLVYALGIPPKADGPVHVGWSAADTIFMPLTDDKE